MKCYDRSQHGRRSELVELGVGRGRQDRHHVLVGMPMQQGQREMGQEPRADVLGGLIGCQESPDEACNPRRAKHL